MGESRECIGSPSVDVAGQNSAQTLRGYENEALGINVTEGGGFDCDEHLRGARLGGRDLATAHVGIHAALPCRSCASDSHADSSQNPRPTPARIVAYPHDSTAQRVRSWRAERWTSPAVKVCALAGWFPDRPTPLNALIEVIPGHPLRQSGAHSVKLRRSHEDLTDTEHGSLRVVGRMKEGRTLFWSVICKCGKPSRTTTNRLLEGRKPYCSRWCPLRRAVAT